MILAQIGGPRETSAIDLVLHGTAPTTVILIVTALASLASWVIILWKAGQFRKMRREGDRFHQTVGHSKRLEDAHRAVLRLPESPYTRVFRQGMNFFSELRPGALRENAAPSPGLSETQLSALWLMLEKVQDEERDTFSAGLVWLSVIAVVAPLLGLLGTVVGVMTSFLGITNTGSANIAAVAPGIAEALVTTACGLVAAIPAAIGYNYFLSRLNTLMGELEGFASEFVGTLAREGRL